MFFVSGQEEGRGRPEGHALVAQGHGEDPAEGKGQVKYILIAYFQII